MKKEFQIYKEGRTTDGPVTILSKEGESFDKQKKIAIFKSLGYTITEIQ